MKACCENCRFWKYLGDKENKYPSGLCRRYAPHPELRDDDGDSVMEVAWPDTDGSDWCGEWAAKTGERMSEDFLAELRDRIDWARYERSAAKDAWDDESADKWQGYLDALLWVERELLRKENA